MIYRGGFGRLLFRWTFTFGNKASIFPGGLEPPEIEFSPPISAFPSFSRSTPCLSTIWQFIVLGKEGEKLGGGSRLKP